MQQVSDSYCTIIYPSGIAMLAMTTNKDGRPWIVGHGSKHELQEQGCVIASLIALTPQLVAALDEIVGLAQYDIDEGYRRDDEIKVAVELVRAMLKEAGEVGGAN